jgi:hypothetical protein
MKRREVPEFRGAALQPRRIFAKTGASAGMRYWHIEARAISGN